MLMLSAAIAVLVLVVVVLQRRRAGGGTGPVTVSRETAVAASRLLSAEAHAEIYRFIGRGNRLEAVRAYRRHTRAGLKQSMAAVQSLEKYPQEYKGQDFDA